MRVFLLTTILSILTTYSLFSSPIVNGVDSTTVVVDTLSKDEKKSVLGDPVPVKQVLKNITFSGYSRFFGFARTLDDVYGNAIFAEEPKKTRTPERVLGFSDGYQRREPIVRLDMVARPTANTEFSMDLVFASSFDGDFHRSDTLSNYYGYNLGLNLEGKINTDFGKFKVQAGGINWQRISPLTMWQFEGYDRTSFFERQPFAPQEVGLSQVNELYSRGAVDRDTRFGRRPLNGFVLDAVELPKGFSGIAMFGKTQIEEFDSFIFEGYRDIPQYLIAGGVKKQIKATELSINTFNNVRNFVLNEDGTVYTTINGSIPYANAKSLSNVVTAGINTKIRKIKLETEFGIGRLVSADASRSELDWIDKDISGLLEDNFAFDVKLSIPKELTKLVPINLEVFSIGRGYVAPNASFRVNGTPEVYTKGQLDQTVLDRETGFQAPNFNSLNDVGQLSNNNLGFNINTEVEVKKLKIGLGYQNSIQHVKDATQVTFENRINGLTVGRFAPFSRFGVDQRVTSTFRGSYTTMKLEQDSDVQDIIPLEKLSFVTVQAHLKYNTTLFGRDLYGFYVPTIGSINNGYHGLPNLAYNNFNSSAILKYQAHEMDWYYQVVKPVVIVVAGGFEKAQGNWRTVRDATTGLPLDTESYFVGFGGNIDLSPNVALYLRHKIFDHFDRSYDYDQYGGHETTAELKMFF